MAAMAVMSVMAAMAAMAKTMLTIKNFVINRRMFLNQAPQKLACLQQLFVCHLKIHNFVTDV